MLKRLIDRCEAAWRVSLEEIGLRKKYGPGLFVMDVSEDTVGHLGLPRIAHQKTRSIELNPVVWVSHVPLEVKLAELKGRAVPKRYKAPGAIIKQFGYLTPRRRFTSWRFSEESDVEALSRELAASVVEYAFPFYQEHATLRGFYDSMRTQKYGKDLKGYAYRLPVAALMLGMPEAAKRHIAEYLAKLEEAYSDFRPAERLPIPREVGIGFRLASGPKPEVVNKYREFADRLLPLMADSDASSE